MEVLVGFGHHKNVHELTLAFKCNSKQKQKKKQNKEKRTSQNYTALIHYIEQAAQAIKH